MTLYTICIGLLYILHKEVLYLFSSKVQDLPSVENNSHPLTSQLVASLDKIYLRGKIHSSSKKLTSPR